MKGKVVCNDELLNKEVVCTAKGYPGIFTVVDVDPVFDCVKIQRPTDQVGIWMNVSKLEYAEDNQVEDK